MCCFPFDEQADEGPRLRSPEDDWALPMTALEQDMEDQRPRQDPDECAWPNW